MGSTARRPSHTSRVAAGGGAAGQLLAAARPGAARPCPHRARRRPPERRRPGQPGRGPAARRGQAALAATSLALQGLVSPLAGLEGLWDAPIAWDDPPALHRLERGLVEAEVKLSAYRRALHERIDACTAQLVDHYQRDPAQIVR